MALLDAVSLCEADWSLYNGYCYRKSLLERTQEAARVRCQNDGGDLVSISDKNEMNFVAQLS